jgi:predicted ATPase/DNA-binding winged helix-turn-helix (wHTH) protein
MMGPVASALTPPRIEIVAHRREALVDGAPLRIGDRAFDILRLLVEARGEPVTSDEIRRRVWPGVVVEKDNLKVHISALRRALADNRDILKTLPGRGYQLVALSDGAKSVEVARVAETTVRAPSNIPASVTELIGREEEVRKVVDRVAAKRLVTLTGPGGIGKTRLALEVARLLVPKFADGVWVVDLATVSDPNLVPAAVTATLGLDPASGPASPEQIARALAEKRLLLVLDSCEHVVDGAARCAEALLRRSARLHVLATGREPLGVRGESIHRVPPLALPDDDISDQSALLGHGSVKLFVSLGMSAAPQLASDPQALAAAAAICRRLDGIPLAIELAAARVATLGLTDLATWLSDRFKLLTGGRRTALPRHQTLRATLDWSYDTLSGPERVAFGCLAVFSGSFSLQAATSVAAGGGIAAAEAVDCIQRLVLKSLVTFDVRSGTAQYRLLETMREYAQEKLDLSGTQREAARHHAQYFLDLFTKARAEWETQAASEWLPTYRNQLGNLRAALDWAFSPDGDTDLGVDLLVASVPLWTQLSLMEECRERVERALAQLGPLADQPTRRNMHLYAALAYSLSPSPAALAKALDMAEALDDNACRLQALWGLWTNRMASVVLDEAIALANRFTAHATDPSDRAIGERMLGFTHHFLGNHAIARGHLERMLDERAPDAHGSRSVRFQFDPWVTARATLGEVLWILGYPEQAMRAVEIAVADAQVIDHVHSLCNTLRKACPIAVFNGDMAALDRFTSHLLSLAAKHGFSAWHAQARCYTGLILMERGDSSGGLKILRAVLEDHPGNSAMRSSYLRAVLAEALGRAGEAELGHEMIDGALAGAEAKREGWCLPELLRIKGDLFLATSGRNVAAAEQHLSRSLDLARQQDALSWELRAATSLALLRRDQGRSAEARTLLSAVLARFTEGFGTADIRRAQALLSALA